MKLQSLYKVWLRHQSPPITIAPLHSKLSPSFSIHPFSYQISSGGRLSHSFNHQQRHQQNAAQNNTLCDRKQRYYANFHIPLSSRRAPFTAVQTIGKLSGSNNVAVVVVVVVASLNFHISLLFFYFLFRFYLIFNYSSPSTHIQLLLLFFQNYTILLASTSAENEK